MDDVVSSSSCLSAAQLEQPPPHGHTLRSTTGPEPVSNAAADPAMRRFAGKGLTRGRCSRANMNAYFLLEPDFVFFGFSRFGSAMFRISGGGSPIGSPPGGSTIFMKEAPPITG